MRRKILMCADEIELGDHAHHPDWTSAPQRVATVIFREVRNDRVYFQVAGGTGMFSHRVDEMIEVVRL